MSGRRAIGIGCGSDGTVDDVLALIYAAAGTQFDPGTKLATLDRRADIAAKVADALKLELMLFAADRLAAVPGVASPSARTKAAVGTPSVAEAAALAALGDGARLVVPRRTGRRCTCAVAALP